MNVLGVGPAELIVILVVALIFVGPERLPRLAADLARTIREIRQYTGNLAAEFTDVVKDFEKETEGERSSFKEIGEGISGATQSVTDAIRSARADATVGGSPAVPAPTPAAPPSTIPASVIEPEWRDIGDAPPATASAAIVPSNNNGHVAATTPTDEAR